jgi:hypothetical protein
MYKEVLYASQGVIGIIHRFSRLVTLLFHKWLLDEVIFSTKYNYSINPKLAAYINQ